MTNQQFEYLYNQARRHFKKQKLPVRMSRQEFRTYLNLMFSNNLPDVPVDVVERYIHEQTDHLLKEINSQTALDRELLEQYVSLEE